MRYFWDTSAIGSFLFEERQSGQVREYSRARKALRGYLSFFGVLEIESVFQRKLSRGDIEGVERHEFRSLLRGLVSNMAVIHSDAEIAEGGQRVIAEYSLRSGDALQLSTARLVQSRLGQVTFLSFDERLNRCAVAEGMQAPFLA